jgi:hypothetical protein
MFDQKKKIFFIDKPAFLIIHCIVRIKRQVYGIDFSQQLPDIFWMLECYNNKAWRRLGQLGVAWVHLGYIKYIGICGA